jgi:arginase
VAGASRGQRTGLLWVDAHGDFNTPESSPSGNIHGMPLATLCGIGDPRLVDIGWKGAKVSPHDVVLLGVRSLDPREREMIRGTGVTVYTMTEIDRWGLARIAEEIVERMRVLPRVHVSLDADVLDPEVAPGVGTPVHGGLTYREAHLLMEILYEAEVVSSLDLVEVNPILDRHNLTARTMVELTGSLVGKAIF